MNLVLASASPRRIELIKKLEYLNVIVRPSSIEERTDKILPQDVVIDLALRKASSIVSDELVLGADTIVVIDGKILGKPHSEAQAKEMFRTLCGKAHSVMTGIALIKGDKVITDCEKTIVRFGEYDEKVIDEYVRSGKPFDKAGGYGLQDKELSTIIEGLTGDYDNVLGLPTRLISRLIRENFYG